jgi:hypothetical protein
MIKRQKTLNKFISVSILLSFYFFSCTNSEKDCNDNKSIAELESYVDCLQDVLKFEFTINNNIFKAVRKHEKNAFKICLEATGSNDSLTIINDLIFSSFYVQIDECDEVLNCQLILGTESDFEHLILKLVRKEDLNTKTPLEEPLLKDILYSHDTLFDKIWSN